MRVKLTLFSESVILDGRSNLVSIINLFEGITPFGFPATIPKLTFLVMLEREQNEQNEYTGNITLTNNRHSLFNGPITINFQGGVQTRLILEINGVLIHEPGVITGRISVNGTDLVIEETININAAVNVSSQPIPS